MMLLAIALAVALAVKLAGILVWGWLHDTVRASDQEWYDWKFESIVRHETGELPDRANARSLTNPR